MTGTYDIVMAGGVESMSRVPMGTARLMGSMLVGLEVSGGRWGFQAMCEAGGMANATIIERVYC